MKTLTNREKILLKILGVAVLLIAVYYLLVIPVGKIIDGDENISNKDEFQILESLYTQYKDIKQKNTSYSAMLNKANENITTMVEQWANTAGIARNLSRTTGGSSNLKNKYVKQTTDIRIEGVAIQDFFRFLYEVENSDYLVKVSELRIRPALKGTSTYDINIKINNYTLKKF